MGKKRMLDNGMTWCVIAIVARLCSRQAHKTAGHKSH